MEMEVDFLPLDCAVNTNGGVNSNRGDNSHVCMSKHVLPDENVDSHKYYLSRRTVMEMLKDRGYQVESSELTRSFDEFLSEFGAKPDIEKLRFSVPFLSNSNGKDKAVQRKMMVVVYMGKQEVKLAAMRLTLFQVHDKENLKGIIIILQGKMNSYAKKELNKLPCKVEVFHIADLLMNVTKHILEPRHELLTPVEKQKLLNEYKAENKNLPMMLATDAIARYYGLQKGQVLKITYGGGGLVESLVTYRCVT